MKYLPSRYSRLALLSCAATASLSLSCYAQDPIPFPNAGFEEGLQGWLPTKEDAAAAISQASTEAAHSGTQGMRVKQGVGIGSWLQGPRLDAQGGKTYRLQFWVRYKEASGIGVWVSFFDAQGQNIKTPAQIALQIPQAVKDWTLQQLNFAAPDGATGLRVAVHAYSNQSALADFDDFSLVPIAAMPAAPSPPPPPAPRPYNGPFITPPDAARVKEIAAYLDPAPHGLGFTLDDRKTWDAVAATDDFRAVQIPRAEKFLNEPIPVVDEAVYAAAVQSGSRDIGAAVDRRRFRLVTFVLAEGMENKGRFVPAIEKELAAICSEKSWIIPAHVRFTGKNDLGSGMTAWTVATAVSMLGNRLSEPTRQMVKDAVNSKVVQPFLEEMRDLKAAPDFWRNSGANWNAVVHGGITGAALALDDSVQERAEIIAAAEKETQDYIKGFPADGYSTEGMGYWKYGFGHYVMLCEAVLAATHGKVNLYDKENIRQVAQFPRRFEIAPNVYPAYSDAAFKDDPPTWISYILDKRYGLGDNAPRTLSVGGMFSPLLYAWSVNLAFDPAKFSLKSDNASIVKGHRLRDWFPVSQVYIGRLPEAQKGLNLSFKGGNNGTSHGHNDLGSFVVAANGVPLIVDPGSTVYTAATFGPQRYSNVIINSYGHSVPRAAGQIQSNGDKFFATISDPSFADKVDSVTLDLTKGYTVPSLTKLQRTFAYDRAAQGAVTVTDRAEFNSPQAFGTALATFGDAKEEAPGVWTISQNGQSLRATIDAGGAPFTVTNELLKDEAAAGKVHRLGIEVNAPAAQSVITVKITPVG